MMTQLVVLHERAVDDGNTEVDVEQNRHRLHFANDDVAEHANEREQPFAVRASPRQLPDSALVFLA